MFFGTKQEFEKHLATSCGVEAPVELVEENPILVKMVDGGWNDNLSRALVFKDSKGKYRAVLLPFELTAQWP